MAQDRLTTILLIDDDPGVLATFKVLLQTEGYMVFTANSAEEGLVLYRGLSTDLIITDLKMPGMDGLQLIQRLKKMSPEVLIIAASGIAHGDGLSLDAAQRHGAYLTLEKPVRRKELLAAVALALS